MKVYATGTNSPKSPPADYFTLIMVDVSSSNYFKFIATLEDGRGMDSKCCIDFFFQMDHDFTKYICGR